MEDKEEAVADEEGEEPSEKEEDVEVEVEMDEDEWGGEGVEEADDAMEEEVEKRAGEMVEEEGKENVELLIDWEDIKGDEEEVDEETEDKNGASDG